MERNDKCFCGSGKKYKKCHSHINSDSIIANMYICRRDFDKKIAELKISSKCLENCYECCKDYFFITENEFLLILDYLIINNYNVDEYVENAKMSYEKIKANHSDLIQKLDDNMNIGNSRNISEYYNDFEYNKDLPFCIFLKSGKCEIYKVRPDVCRTYGTTSKCQRIDNENLSFDEFSKMIISSEFVDYENIKIMPRQYPLFYWFYYFLGTESMFNLTMKKLKFARNYNSSQYGKNYYKLTFNTLGK